MTKQNYSTAAKMEESVLTVDMNKLTIANLAELVQSQDDEIVLNSNRRFVVLHTSNSFDLSILQSLANYEKTIRKWVGVYIAENEPIFSEDDADIILHIMKLQQKEQKEKDEKV